MRREYIAATPALATPRLLPGLTLENVRRFAVWSHIGHVLPRRSIAARAKPLIWRVFLPPSFMRLPVPSSTPEAVRFSHQTHLWCTVPQARACHISPALSTT